jgi:hypothetical protein
MRMSLHIDEKKHPAGVRLLLGNHPPSRICKRGRMNGGGGIRIEPVGSCGEVISTE